MAVIAAPSYLGITPTSGIVVREVEVEHFTLADGTFSEVGGRGHTVERLGVWIGLDWIGIRLMIYYYFGRSV